jgi:hypothetical protein
MMIADNFSKSALQKILLVGGYLNRPHNNKGGQADHRGESKEGRRKT